MKSWNGAVNAVVPATARSTCSSPSTWRRTVIPPLSRASVTVPPREVCRSIPPATSAIWPARPARHGIRDGGGRGRVVGDAARTDHDGFGRQLVREGAREQAQATFVRGLHLASVPAGRAARGR